jgi:hypothetical protein
MDVEAESRDLKRRIGELEGSFGFLTQQVKGVHRDLLTFQTQAKQGFEEVNGRLERLEREGRSFREELPEIVGTVMREVLREDGTRSRKRS